AIEKLHEVLAQQPNRRIDLEAIAAFEGVTGDGDPTSAFLPDAKAAIGSELCVLCRNLEQVEAASRESVDWVYVDLHDVRQYKQAREIATEHSRRLAIASVRIQKPGEMGLLRVLQRHRPDAVLGRNLAALKWAIAAGIPAIADFSLNVTNQHSADWLLGLGVQRVTASYDLNRDQCQQLLHEIRPRAWQWVIHQHMPMFHMEHCVFCSVMSPGTNKTNCGRPCDRHRVQLRDRVGALHVLQADVACRNTLYNETPQSGAEIVGELQAAGVQSFRIELLEQSAEASVRTIRLYRDLLDGRVDAPEVWRRLKADNRVGVTRGTLEPKSNPLAIL
ncbi:MAG: U32 family peptidase, partial [Planctomycetota bacterium]